MGSLPLNDDDRSQLSARADEFHAALARGAVGDWGRFLAGLPERLRKPVLTELVIIDLIHRWEHGEQPQVEEYLARFPELGPLEEVPPGLIVEECRCRVKAGERPDPKAFAERFPTQFSLIQRELESLRGETLGGTAATLVNPLPPDPLAPLPKPSGNTAAEYEFIRVLGRGVFGEVWLARKISSGIEKAIKILLQPPDDEGARREREALELIKNLRHPYLLATEDFWISGGRFHIVMELAEATLRQRLRRCQETGLVGIPANELLGHMWEAAEGLDFLHSKHVIHRDVKPDNILLLHGHTKIADFGLAREQEGSLAPMRTLAGTPTYMAPEVWDKQAGPASDQYSLAVSYIELRQGTASLKPRSLEDMLIAHLQGAHEFTDTIELEERRVLNRALTRQPGDRYPSCKAFVEALSAALGRPGAPRASGTLPISGHTANDSAHDPTHPDSLVLKPPLAKRTIADTAADDFLPPEPVPPPSRRGVKVFAVVLVLAIATVLTLGLTGVFDGGGGKPGGREEPSRFVPEPGSREYVLANNRKVHEWVTVGVGVGNERVRFRLVLGTPDHFPVEPFYIMESKVWNNLYRVGGAIPPSESDINGPECPVTHVTVDEARRFAGSALGGRLPTAAEWTHAAGWPPAGRSTVTRGGGTARVGITRPQPTHGPGAGNDVSEYGLLDMAGNGREWTSTIFTPATAPTRRLGESPLAPDDLMVIRGRNFTLATGLTFPTLETENNDPQTQFPTARSPYTGFRVVIPIP